MPPSAGLLVGQVKFYGHGYKVSGHPLNQGGSIYDVKEYWDFLTTHPSLCPQKSILVVSKVAAFFFTPFCPDALRVFFLIMPRRNEAPDPIAPVNRARENEHFDAI